jgi:hypothetical protein
VKRALLLIFAGAGLALGGCGDAAAPPQAKSGGVTISNPHNEQLKALPENLQRIALTRAIRDTGNRCPRSVESRVEQGEYRGMAYWTARCDDNRQWAIFLAPNGDVQVRNCGDMQQLDLPPCQALPPAPPQPERRPAQPRPKAGG